MSTILAHRSTKYLLHFYNIRSRSRVRMPQVCVVRGCSATYTDSKKQPIALFQWPINHEIGAKWKKFVHETRKKWLGPTLAIHIGLRYVNGKFSRRSKVLIGYSDYDIRNVAQYCVSCLKQLSESSTELVRKVCSQWPVLHERV